MWYTWLSSYLVKRSHFVCIDNVKSTLRNMLCGVQRGLILGQKLYFIYINDFSDLAKLILFVDDTNIFYCADDH